MTVSQNDIVRNILVRGDELAIWYSGSSSVFTSKLSESNLSYEFDKFSQLITYEKIYDVASEDIIDAAYLERSDQACIFAAYKTGRLGYVTHLYISVDSGLLLFSYVYDGDTLISSMESVSSEFSTPPDEVFRLPVE
jgi:hypothetical protein